MSGDPRAEALPLSLSRDFDERHSKIAFITGGKVYRLARERLGTISDIVVKETPFGCSTPILFLQHMGSKFYVLPRHGEREYRRSAPFVNYRANIWALKELGTRHIIAWTGPGALLPELAVGDFVLPGDLIDLTKNRPTTFFENRGIGLLRQSPTFCPTLAGLVGDVMASVCDPVHHDRVYAVSEGPRFETLAEVRMLRSLGADLVGSTLAPEAFLARELEMCYQPIAYVTSFANGVAEIADSERRDRVAAAVERVPDITWGLLEAIEDVAYACSCQDAMFKYKQRGVIGDDFREWIR